MKQIVRAISMRPRANLQFSLYQLRLRLSYVFMDFRDF